MKGHILLVFNQLQSNQTSPLKRVQILVYKSHVVVNLTTETEDKKGRNGMSFRENARRNSCSQVTSGERPV